MEAALLRKGPVLSMQGHGRELAQLWVEPSPPPEGVEARHARAGYLHPIKTPTGRIVTGDYPLSHPHQHGVFAAWTRASVAGHQLDFWNTGDDTGRVEVVGLENAGIADGAAWAVLDLVSLDLTASRGPAPVMEERWEVVARATPSLTLVEVELDQRASTLSPLDIEEYHYGGFAWRGPQSWSTARCEVRTSEGSGRSAGEGERVRWVAFSGLVESMPVTVALMGHPDNPRAPQPVRIHETEPYACFAPQRLGAFTISVDQGYRARYAVLAYDGAIDDGRIDHAWSAWVDSTRE